MKASLNVWIAPLAAFMLWLCGLTNWSLQFFGEELLDVLCCLIIHHIYFWLVPFSFYQFEMSFVYLKNTLVIQVGNWNSKDSICFSFIVIHHKETHTSIQWHEWEVARQVVIHDTGHLLQMHHTKQNTFAINSSSTLTAGPFFALCVGPG